VEALDGNALAGPLFDYFGVEMTVARGLCAYCGAGAQIAELRVYTRAPGTVARCPHCGNAVMVMVSIGDTQKVHLSGFRLGD
jgi:ribosomal protein S27AE